MVAFPNCKINLGLNIIRKRADGYHDLETVFYPVPLRDALEIIRQPSTVNRHLTSVNFSSTGLTINGAESDNLCVKAYKILQKDFPDLPVIHMHLHKVIPMGAGLGGGSADGAFALQLLNNTFKLNLNCQQLITYALQLGSDCPFFIENKPCFATGRGEKMQPIELDLSNYQMVIINPKIHIGTSWAFANITPQIPKKSVLQIIQQPIATWRNELVNDFENPAINQYPEIGNIKNTLYNKGAIYSAMTGSGSSVFGIFKKQQTLHFSFPEHYFIFHTL
ncbi:MAG: 4-(cytidine 5'-diphospho)-2-C-methyl-D-erythritol kinase [Deinococcales bacterium]|nr:4-(cytidine 5'-diphospho)-2-C-methyl-D-erythritol kinase [Chitinophagaceae bacterium]